MPELADVRAACSAGMSVLCGDIRLGQLSRSPPASRAWPTGEIFWSIRAEWPGEGALTASC